MADTVNVGGVNYSTDDITTLNGGVVAAGSNQTQRIKVQYGDDGSARDVSAAFPLPVQQPDGTATGTITATDAVLGTHTGLGAVLTGTPTAGSYVVYKMTGGESGFTLRLSGTFGGGTVWIESSPDSTNGVDGGWSTNLMRQSGVDITFNDASITGPGIFRGVSAGYSYLRVRITGATAPNVAVAFRVSGGPSVTALVASLPPGTNTIGNVGLAATQSRTSGYTAAASTAFTAGAAVAAAAYSALGGAIDNSTALDLYDDLELVVTFAVAPVVNTLVEVYQIPSLDGTNYADSSIPAPNLYVGGFPVKAVTTAQRLIVRGVPLPPGLFQYQLRNGTAQPLPQTTTVMRRRPYRLQLG